MEKNIKTFMKQIEQLNANVHLATHFSNEHIEAHFCVEPSEISFENNDLIISTNSSEFYFSDILSAEIEKDDYTDSLVLHNETGYMVVDILP